MIMTKQYSWLITALGLACLAPGVAAQISSGTAFAVASELLITNQHVIAGCTSVEILAADGRRTGSVVDADVQIDLALLRVGGIKGATARLRNPRNVRLGESVMVFGFPLTGALSSSGNFTSGLVSALRGLRDAAGELQITAPVQPGNSGGPLMDSSGLVIGVVQAKLDALRSAIATGDIPQNVNFAISLEVLADFLAKNQVPFRDGAISLPLDTAWVAELAQSFTYRVQCRSSSRQAGPSPGMKPKPPMEVPPDDRRSVGAQTEDKEIYARGESRINDRFGDKVHISVTSFNRNVLLTGEAPDTATKAQIENILRRDPNVRALVNEVQVAEVSSHSSRGSDTYITSKVKARFVDSGAGFSANHVKVVTESSVVYLLGLVTRTEADAAVEIARTTGGVQKVVRVFEYIEAPRK